MQACKPASGRAIISTFGRGLVRPPDSRQFGTANGIVFPADIRPPPREPDQTPNSCFKTLETENSGEPGLILPPVDLTTRRVVCRRSRRGAEGNLGHPLRVIGYGGKIQGPINLCGPHPLGGVA